MQSDAPCCEAAAPGKLMLNLTVTPAGRVYIDELKSILGIDKDTQVVEHCIHKCRFSEDTLCLEAKKLEHRARCVMVDAAIARIRSQSASAAGQVDDADNCPPNES